jgi:hypothetical protein
MLVDSHFAQDSILEWIVDWHPWAGVVIGGQSGGLGRGNEEGVFVDAEGTMAVGVKKAMATQCAGCLSDGGVACHGRVSG